MNAALIEAMERLRKKNQALEIEKAQAVERFHELEAKLRKARVDLAELRQTLFAERRQRLVGRAP